MRYVYEHSYSPLLANLRILSLSLFIETVPLFL